IFEIFVISINLKLLSCTAKEIVPFVECCHDCQHFSVVDLIIMFRRIEAFR
ncbi:hypothetical protein GLOTRDRAFT_41982, partial [Gloeophyllum trabeum ATCC 11539]